MRKLLLASAGAGKSRTIVEQSLEKVALGERVLIITYTEKNQEELVKKFQSLNGFLPAKVVIKGWFTFLLEDMVRPYQSCLFNDRIPGIYFNPVDPHKRNGRNIRGLKEKIETGYNAEYFLTSKEGRVHTTYISKLAVRINDTSGGKPILRLSEIYQSICIDEVQDLTGWDFEVIKAISDSSIKQFFCVGDFRQTLYLTHLTIKKPKENIEKLSRFDEIGLTRDQLSISWRCIQKICDCADIVHKDEGIYDQTESKVEIGPNCVDHLGVFVVRPDKVETYLDKYQPKILRFNRSTQEELCKGRDALNFGEAKGMGFNRILICPTKKHERFLAGENNIFNKDKTSKAKNSLYVALTRARFSVAFLYDGNVSLDGVEIWHSS